MVDRVLDDLLEFAGMILWLIGICALLFMFGAAMKLLELSFNWAFT